jgi:uridine phosphorylase
MGDRVVAREAVKWQGCALEYASKELKGDRAVIRFSAGRSSTPPRSSRATERL